MARGLYVHSGTGWVKKGGWSGGGGTVDPGTPSTLAASAVSSAEIKLEWTAATDAARYEVERTAFGRTEIITRHASFRPHTWTHLQDVALPAGAAPSYRVRGVKSDGTALAWSEPATATTPAAPTATWATVFAAGGAALREWFYSPANTGPRVAIDWANPLPAQDVKSQAAANALAGKRVTGRINVSAAAATDGPAPGVIVLRDVWVDLSVGDPLFPIKGVDGRVEVEYCVIDGGDGADQGTNGVDRVEFCRIRGGEDGIRLKTGGAYRYNVIHDLAMDPAKKANPHHDAFQSTGDSNIIIERNYVDFPRFLPDGTFTPGTQMVLIKTDSADTIDNVKVDSNFFEGGHIPCQSRKGTRKDANGVVTSQPPTNVQFTNNRFGRNYGETIANLDTSTDTLFAIDTATGSGRSGNVWDDTGLAVH